MVDIIHRIGIQAPPAKVYEAIATAEGIAGWWSEETRGESKVGETLTVTFRDHEVEKGRAEFEVLALNPGREVKWRVTEGPPEWVGTDITFDIASEDGQTIVLFGHRNWREAAEFMAHCSMKWATFLLSLRGLVEDGGGKPSPHDLKIDNWN